MTAERCDQQQAERQGRSRAVGDREAGSPAGGASVERRRVLALGTGQRGISAVLLIATHVAQGPTRRDGSGGNSGGAMTEDEILAAYRDLEPRRCSRGQHES